MADISQHVDPIAAEIYAAYEKTGKAEPSRGYLGASAIGDECARKLWYGFRWASPTTFDGRMYRLFQTGHLEEPRLIADLRAIGCEVWDRDPATGRQFRSTSHAGHMAGHCDGVAKRVPSGGGKEHLLEFKTASTKDFNEMKKNGVQKAKPVHFAQMTWYMGKMGLDRALYIMKCKETDELYTERVPFDKVEFERIEAKAERIIFSQEPPPRIKDDPKYYLCSWCDHAAVCHGHKVPALSCRSCVHSTPERTGDARWSCAKWQEPEIPIEHQRQGCDQHLPLPFLLTYATPMDAGDGWIEFRRKDNQREFVVAVPGVTHPHPDMLTYSSLEVSSAKDHRAICDPGVQEFREVFGATIGG